MAAGLKMIQDGLAFLQPQLLRWLLLYITEYQRARSNGEDTPNPVQGFTIAIIMVSRSSSQTNSITHFRTVLGSDLPNNHTASILPTML
jgi:hypothetical protein